jgi:hypothetical protein
MLNFSAGAVAVLCVTLAPAIAKEMQFPDASETIPELISFWNESTSACRSAHSVDVKVAVACLSRNVYGAALNERSWCIGKPGQSNADMEWHRCGAASLRFPPFEIPKP